MTETLPYALFCFWLFAIAQLELHNILGKRGQKSCLFISLFILTTLAGMREIEPATDTWNYVLRFHEIGGFFAPSAASFDDIGFVLLVKIAKLFSDDASFFLWIYALFEAALLWFVANKFTQKPNIFIFFFFLLYYLSLFHIIIRQGVASLLLVIFVFSFLEKQYFRAILYGFLAFLFHKTAIIFMFALGPTKILAKNKYRILLIAISTGLFFLIFSVKDILYYFTFFASYRYLDYAQNQLTLNYEGYAALSIAILGFLFLLRKRIDAGNDFIFLLVLIGTIMQLALMPLGPFVERIAEYWLIFLPILFANVFSLNSITKVDKNYLFYFYGAIFMLVFCYFLLKQNYNAFA